MKFDFLTAIDGTVSYIEARPTDDSLALITFVWDDWTNPPITKKPSGWVFSISEKISSDQQFDSTTVAVPSYSVIQYFMWEDSDIPQTTVS